MTGQERDASPCCAHSNGPPAQALFAADAEAARHARKHVRELLAHDEVWRDADERLDDVLLIVSELVTNAYRYGSTADETLLVKVLTTTETVRIEVADRLRARPRLRTESDERAGGHGLHIVNALAARWDVNDHPFGKTVWAEVTR